MTTLCLADYKVPFVHIEVIKSSDRAGNTVWKVVMNGQPHPAYFTSPQAASAHAGLLSGRGHQLWSLLS